MTNNFLMEFRNSYWFQKQNFWPRESVPFSCKNNLLSGCYFSIQIETIYICVTLAFIDSLSHLIKSQKL